MADRSISNIQNAQRVAVLSAARVNAAPAISIAPLEMSARFSLRLRAAAATQLSGASPFRFDISINTCTSESGRTIARLGPDEWLLLCPDDDGESLARELNTALAGQPFSLVDIGHRNVGIAVAGNHAREVINAGCPLDLHHETFPPCSATRTLLGKAEIVLLRPGTAASYRVECWRSFAPYAYALLRDAAREFVGQEKS